MSDRMKLMEAQIKANEKKWGAGKIARLSQLKQEWEVIPTGSLSLDHALGIGGFPRGCASVIWGAENAGKSTLAYSFCAQTIKVGGIPFLIDMENKGSPAWIKKNVSNYGVDADNLYVAQPETGNEAIELAYSMIGLVDSIVVDSATSLVTKAEIEEGDSSKSHMGVQARFLSTNIKKMTAKLGHPHPETGLMTAFLFTAQLRYKIGVMFGNPEHMPGGQALYQYAIIVARLRQSTKIKEGDRVIGAKHTAYIEKNQADAPYGKAEFYIFYDRGIHLEMEILEKAVELGIVEKKGSFYNYGETRLGQGQKNAAQFLADNQEYAEEISARVMQ